MELFDILIYGLTVALAVALGVAINKTLKKRKAKATEPADLEQE
jgi:hypothetical protein